jgi:hypothetical protein
MKKVISKDGTAIAFDQSGAGAAGYFGGRRALLPGVWAYGAAREAAGAVLHRVRL